MYDFVPKSILPVDYGGHQPTMDQLSSKHEYFPCTDVTIVMVFVAAITSRGFASKQHDVVSSSIYLQSLSRSNTGSWSDKLNEWRDWFIAEEKVYVDEKLRHGPTVDGDELFGFSGSFRQLEVD